MMLGWESPAYAMSLMFFCLASASHAFSLQQTFSSPSGKLTYSPELVIPAPKDPTAILLLTNSVQTLSERIRSAQCNAAFVDGSIASLRTFCNEQIQAEGGFPGPVPVIYCGKETDYESIQEAGAKAVLVSTPLDGLGENADFRQQCQDALSVGLEPVPELILAVNTLSMEGLVDTLQEVLGQRPKAVVLTPPAGNEEEDGTISDPVLPSVPKEISKEFPVIGSVRTLAGDGRLSSETSRLKDAGFNGAFLRSDCVPGFRLQPDLEIVSSFWQAVITDLKSTKSKSFGFRSKNNLNVSASTKWGNYQKNILESGALGDPNESFSGVDSAAGDYQGFA